MSFDHREYAENVLPLKYHVPISEKFTVRHRMYQDRLARLSDADRKTVLRMEALLFSARLTVACCVMTIFPFPVGRFECNDGLLDFYYSEQDRKCVLTNFVISLNGGLVNVSDDLRRAQVECSRAASGKFGVAARLEDLLQKFILMNEIDVLNYSNESEYISDNQIEMTVRDVARTLSSFRFGRSSKILPRWSLLGSAASVPQQIENQFARTILAGEITCKICSEMVHYTLEGSALGLDFGLGRKFLNRKKFFREGSRDILKAIDTGFLPSEIKKYNDYYQSLNMIKKFKIDDSEILQIIFGEIIFKMAIFLNKKKIVATYRNDFLNYNSNSFEDYVLKQYSLIGEFVYLATSYISPGRGGGVDVCFSKDDQSYFIKEKIKLYRDILRASTFVIYELMGGEGVEDVQIERLISVSEDIFQ